MGYDSQIYDAVYERLSERRRKAEGMAMLRKKELYENIPRLEQIERDLAGAGIAVARAVLSGGRSSQLIEELKNKNLSLQKEREQILASLSLPADYFEPQYVCKLCNDKGNYQNKVCKCMKQLLKEEACKRLNSISPMELSSFDTFKLEFYSDTKDPNLNISPKAKMADIFSYCKDYASCFSFNSKSLLMYGNTGLGKTHLSLAIANDVINKGFGVIYGSTQNFINTIEKERFSKDYNDKTDYFEILNNCDLLILDDLGAEFSTNFSASVLYNIINTRINSHKPTIISTNLMPAELDNKYPDRIVSRITGSFQLLRFMGSDIRQLKRKNYKG